VYGNAQISSYRFPKPLNVTGADAVLSPTAPRGLPDAVLSPTAPRGLPDAVLSLTAPRGLPDAVLSLTAPRGLPDTRTGRNYKA
jgi:hypothetical protein